jgi:paired amphipathic helix protein Sin3a
MYRLMYADEHWYLFFRYHQILCERLHKVYKYSLQIAENESADLKTREQSVAEALKLRNKSDIPVDEYYPTFLDIARNLLDGNMDSGTYEDQMREMFGIQAYTVFTLDKVVHNCVRQLQYLVQDEKSIGVKQLYTEECKVSGVSGAGGKLANMAMANVMNAELNYQKKSETLLSDEHVYKILIVSLLSTKKDLIALNISYCVLFSSTKTLVA